MTAPSRSSNKSSNSPTVRPYVIQQQVIDGAPAWAAVFQDSKGGRYWLTAENETEAQAEARDAERSPAFQAS